MIDDIRKPMLACCSELLKPFGFTKRIAGLYTVQLAADVLGWIGLNQATKVHGLLEVNVIVAVRHQAIEKLLAEMKNVEYHSYAPPTVGTHIGYVMPEKKYHPWFYSAQDDIPSLVGDMVQAIVTYGLPFMHSLLELPKVTEALISNRYDYIQHNAYRIPVALTLLGRYGEAKDYLDEMERELERGIQIYKPDYRQFLENLRKKLKCIC